MIADSISALITDIMNSSQAGVDLKELENIYLNEIENGEQQKQPDKATIEKKV